MLQLLLSSNETIITQLLVLLLGRLFIVIVIHYSFISFSVLIFFSFFGNAVLQLLTDVFT